MSIEDRINEQKNQINQQKKQLEERKLKEEDFLNLFISLGKRRNQEIDLCFQILNPIISQIMLDLFKYKFNSNISRIFSPEDLDSYPGKIFQDSQFYFIDVVKRKIRVDSSWDWLTKVEKDLANAIEINQDKFKSEKIEINQYIWIFRNEILKCKFEHYSSETSHSSKPKEMYVNSFNSVEYISGFYGFCVVLNNFYLSILDYGNKGISINLKDLENDISSKIEEMIVNINLRTYFCVGKYPDTIKYVLDSYLYNGIIKSNTFTVHLSDEEIKKNFTNNIEKSTVVYSKSIDK